MINKLELEEHIYEIEGLATSMGLDFFEMKYEICPKHVISTIATYGMPNRFQHWTFGVQYEKFRGNFMGGKIYELVINSDPCYAFLLNTNSMIENKLIIAHVLAHSDFFKQNVHFKKTKRRMLDALTNNADMILRYEKEYGLKEVEDVLETALNIDEHSELLGVVSETLSGWQADIFRAVKKEMDYFEPQRITKLINEGWATYWHSRILRELSLTTEEVFDYSKLHSGVLTPSKKSINPYLFGYKMFEYAGRDHGYDHLFDIRSTYGDYSFIRDYFTKEVCDEVNAHIYYDSKKEINVDYNLVKQKMLETYEHNSRPYLKNISIDSLNITFEYDGEKELDADNLKEVMKKISVLSKKKVTCTTTKNIYVADSRRMITTENKKDDGTD